MRRAAALASMLALGCGDAATGGESGPVDGSTSGSSDGAGDGTATGGTDGGAFVCDELGPIALPGVAPIVRSASLPAGASCTWTLALAEARVVELVLSSSGWVATLEGEDEPGWRRPIVGAAGEVELVATNPTGAPLEVELEVLDRGGPIAEVVRERSLVWTQPDLVDAPIACGLACVMARVAADGHGGLLLQQWFERFATTMHSQRFGPSDLLDAFAGALGPDPASWDLAALPFVVTAFHNRVDLAKDDHCGEFRVSMASTDPIYRPFHLIFLFRQPPGDGDVSPHGTVHCTAAARAWAELSAHDDAAMLAQLDVRIDALVAKDGFIAAESVEFMIAPWEWRQWFPQPNPDAAMRAVLPEIVDNPPLFQTIDAERLNQPGADRDAMLAWVEDNAAAIDARTIALPDTLRPPSARVNQGVPWIPLELSGVDPAVFDRFPTVRQNLEIVGCPACHATDAEFVQTLPDRTFSPFYDKELDARGEFLRARANGELLLGERAPFGPLQSEPLLPP
jgi:hypothetical protein